MFVEPNYILERPAQQAVTTTSYLTSCQLWGMYGAAATAAVPCANQWGSNAAAAWAAGSTGSSDVYIGIIDEGIQVRGVPTRGLPTRLNFMRATVMAVRWLSGWLAGWLAGWLSGWLAGLAWPLAARGAAPHHPAATECPVCA
jgi:hypothetical protein